MKKFERFNKLTETKEAYVSCQGVVDSITDTTLTNKVSGKKYFRFTADVETSVGTKRVGGQVYESLVPFLGAMPKVGDKLEFNAKLEDLQGGFNSRWGIGGSAIDAVSDDFLNSIADL